jgi:hypothetical protein
MLKSVNKIVLCATEKINILTLVLSEKKFMNETKNHNPPLQVKWSVPNIMINVNKVIGNRSTFLSGSVTLCTQSVKYFFVT